MTLNPKYQPLFKNDTRFFIITGGRGSAKSFSVGTFLNLLSFEQGHKILFTRLTMTSAHLSIIPEFQAKANLMDIASHFYVTKNEIINKTSNSEIIFKGIKTSSGDQTASLKSLQGVTTWVLDEAEELKDETVFDKINLSIRQKGKQNRVILILNPTTKEHWIYKRFFESQGVEGGYNGVKGDTTYIHTSYLDNIEHLDDSFLNEVKRIKKNNPEKYNHTIMGGWKNKEEGVVFDNWEFGIFNPDNLQTSFGQDYGFSVDPTTLIEVAINKKTKTIYVKECVYKKSLTTSEIANLNNIYAGWKLIVADSAEPRLIEELKRLKCNIIPAVKGAGSISAGVELMKDYKIIVDPESKNIAKEFNNYTYSDKKSSLFIDDFNHAIDAMRYIISYHLMINTSITIM